MPRETSLNIRTLDPGTPSADEVPATLAVKTRRRPVIRSEPQPHTPATASEATSLDGDALGSQQGPPLLPATSHILQTPTAEYGDGFEVLLPRVILLTSSQFPEIGSRYRRPAAPTDPVGNLLVGILAASARVRRREEAIELIR